MATPRDKSPPCREIHIGRLRIPRYTPPELGALAARLDALIQGETQGSKVEVFGRQADA